MHLYSSLSQVQKQETRRIFTPAAWRCTESKEVEEEVEESPVAGGEVDVNHPDQLSPPHSRGEKSDAANNSCYYKWTQNYLFSGV